MTTSNKARHSNKRSAKFQRWSIVLGNLLEHFDSSLYGFLAPLVGKAFFPDFSPLYQLILTYGVYAATFFARPLGGIIFSKLTYRYGPLRVLLGSLMGVAISTGLMGVLPGAAHIGILAPCLLVVVRFIQSFCAAGESAIAGYYLIENTSKEKQMPWSSIYQSSTVLGILMASSVSGYILSSSNAEHLWRYAFLSGFGLGLWTLGMRFIYGRMELMKSSLPSFPHEKILPRLRIHWKLVLGLIPIYGFSYLVYSFPLVFLNPFLAQIGSLPMPTLMGQTNVLLWLDALLMPAMAFLVQRFSWFKTLSWSAIVFASSACLLLLFLYQESVFIIYFLRFVMVMGGVSFAAALIPWTASLYPHRDKYLLHSVSYNIGSELFGRSTPFICFWLYALNHHPSSPLIYVLGLTTLTLGLMIWLFSRNTFNLKVLRVNTFTQGLHP